MFRIPTFGKVPRWEPNFKPSGMWLMRPVWYRQACSHVLSGDPRAGKTTFIHEGMCELASMGVYEPEHLKMFPAVRRTGSTSRRSLERNGWNPMIDSWIDVDGAHFLDAFQLNGSAQAKHTSLERIYSRVNSLVILLPAQRLLDLRRHLNGKNPSLTKTAGDYIDGFVERLNALQPSPGRKLKRGGFRWHFLVSQCGDIATTERGRDALADALQHFADKTGLRSVCRRAVLMDSRPKPLIQRGIPVATLELGPRGGLTVSSSTEAAMCSAGVAMAIILGRLKVSSTHHGFLPSLCS